MVREIYEYRRNQMRIDGSGKYQNRYEFSSKIMCKECGGNFRRQKIYIGKPYEKIQWSCKNHIENNRICRTKLMREDAIKAAYLTMWNKLASNHTFILAPMLDSLRNSELYKVTSKKAGAAKYSSQFALTEILICAECGSRYRRATWAKNGKKQIVWRCINRLEHGTRVCRNSPTLKEENIENTIMKVVNSVIYGHRDFTDTLKENILTAISGYTEQPSPKGIDEQISTLQNQLLHYVELNAKAGADSKAYDAKFEQISKEIASLQKQKKGLAEKEKLRTNYTQRVNGITKFMDNSSGITQYDNELVRRLIQSVKVVSKEKLIVQFKSGKIAESCLL